MTVEEYMAKDNISIEDIEALDVNFLTPAKLAKYLRADPYSLSLQAQEDKEKLGFPVIVTGSRTRFPKEGLLFYLRYGRISAVEEVEFIKTMVSKARSEFEEVI